MPRSGSASSEVHMQFPMLRSENRREWETLHCIGRTRFLRMWSGHRCIAELRPTPRFRAWSEKPFIVPEAGSIINSGITTGRRCMPGVPILFSRAGLIRLPGRASRKGLIPTASIGKWIFLRRALARRILCRSRPTAATREARSTFTTKRLSNTNTSSR